MKYYLAKLILKLLNWKYPQNPPDGGPYVCAGYPHTSNWDTFISILIGYAWKVNFYIVVKESFNKPIIKQIMQFFNCLPITRDKKGLQHIITTLRKNNGYIAIAVEGTRKKSNGVKAGFFNISKSLDMKIIPGGPDWKTKTYRVFQPISIEENAEKTIEKYKNIISPFLPMGLYPELESPLVLAKSEKKS